MNKIKKLSYFIRIILQSYFIISVIALIAFTLLAPFVWQHKIAIPHFYSVSFQDLFFPMNISLIGELHATQIILALVISLTPWLVSLAILYCLVKLFKLYEHGCIFNEKNTHYLSRISQLLLLRIILEPIYDAFITLVLTWNNPTGKHIISVAIGSTEFGLIVLSVMILIIAKIMHEATLLSDENRKFV